MTRNRNHTHFAWVGMVLLLVLSVVSGASAASLAGPGTGFTYQGRLEENGAPAKGNYDFRFTLYNAAADGSVVGGPLERADVAVADGYFTTALDFGPVFSGDALWLEISVRAGASTGEYTTLTPRQALTAAPLATYSQSAPWGGLSGVPAGFADGVDNEASYSAGTGLALSGSSFAIASGYRLPQACAGGQIARWNATSGLWECANAQGAAYTAGSGINIDTNGVITTDMAYVQKHINGACGAGYAIRSIAGDGSITCEPVGGAGDITAVAAGAGLSGGGTSGDVTLALGTGYRLPQACGAGQLPKWNAGSGLWECGADSDTTYSSGTGLALSGTQFSLSAPYRLPQVCSSGQVAKWNATFGAWECAADSNTIYSAGTGLSQVGTTFLADAEYLQRRVSGACPAGSSIRVIAPDGTVTCQTDEVIKYEAGNGLALKDTLFVVDPAVTQLRVSGACAAGSSIRAINDNGTVVCEPDDDTTAFWSLTGNAAVGKSYYLGTSDAAPLYLGVNGQRAFRLEPTTGSPNVVGGNTANLVTAGALGATIAGGGQVGGSTNYPNQVTGSFGSVGGGWGNTAGVNGVVSGGAYNFATGGSSSVGGGFSGNATGDYSTVGGGSGNMASGSSSTVAGGNSNFAEAPYGTVGGGNYNFASAEGGVASGGVGNKANGIYSTVAGGRYNEASNDYATVAGGLSNTASGQNSFAAGRRAKATYAGSFVWADNKDVDFNPNAAGLSAANAFNVRATGGIYLVTGINNITEGLPSSGVSVSAGGSGWNVISDRAAKENFAPVAGRDLLDRLAGVPVQSWNYKSQDAAVRHVGPMAQDFNAAFGVGEAGADGEKRAINTIDADGVALAGVQALYQLNQEQAGQIQALQDQVAALKAGGPVSAGASLLTLLPWVGMMGMAFALGWALRGKKVAK